VKRPAAKLSHMKYRAIISEAWALTQEDKKLIWIYAFFPAALSTLVSIVYFGYQVAAFWTSPYINPEIPEEKQALHWIFNVLREGFRSETELTVLLLTLAALVLVAYFLVPAFTQSALIQILARKRAGQTLSIPQGISYGLTRFLQVLEYHSAIKAFSVFGLLGEASFAFRNLGPELFGQFFGWFFLLAIGIGLFFTFMFTFAESYLVIDKESVVSSMVKSSGLVVRQWHHTLFMLFLMSIIVLRIALNLLVALLIPLIVIGPFLLFTNITLAAIGAIVGAVLGLVALYFTSYFVGVFHVFSTAVWTFTFLELTAAEKNDIDVHEAVTGD
jgi:MFS family permease